MWTATTTQNRQQGQITLERRHCFLYSGISVVFFIHASNTRWTCCGPALPTKIIQVLPCYVKFAQNINKDNIKRFSLMTMHQNTKQRRIAIWLRSNVGICLLMPLRQCFRKWKQPSILWGWATSPTVLELGIVQNKQNEITLQCTAIISVA